MTVIANIYIDVIRGTPSVLQLMIMWFIIFSSAKNGVLVAILSFGVNSGAYVAEIVRAGILAVDKGQMEAAYGIGLSGFQAYIRIILPQALRGAVPNLCNLMVALVKNTSLAFMMTVKDLTQTAKLGAALNYRYAEAYIVILVIYILLCLFIEGVFWLIERRLNYEYKERTGIKGISQ